LNFGNTSENSATVQIAYEFERELNSYTYCNFTTCDTAASLLLPPSNDREKMQAKNETK